MRLLLPLFLLSACTDKGADTVAADTGLCADAPVLMWANFGEGFLTENCQSCHASTTLNRHDAPDDVFFDTLDEVKAQSAEILARATGDAPTMPPEGGVEDVEREKLTIWLTCWLDQDPG